MLKRRTASAGFFSQIWDNEYENNLVLKVADNITDDNKYTLDSLLESDDSKSMITKLKVINQSVRPSRIKQNISGFILIKKLYEDNEKLIKLLDLSREATKYGTVANRY